MTAFRRRRSSLRKDKLIFNIGEIGYGSEAAFNRAFRREFDCPPAQFHRKRKALGA
jgi:AraC-like DNA-binding protein